MSNIPAAQIIQSISKWYNWCILGMSQTSLKVSDPDLFLTYFTRSDMFTGRLGSEIPAAQII